MSDRFIQWQATAEILLCFYWEGQQVSCSGHPLCFSFLLCILRTCIDSCDWLSRRDTKDAAECQPGHPAGCNLGSVAVIWASSGQLSGAQGEAKYLCQIQFGLCWRKLSYHLNHETLCDPLKLHGTLCNSYCPRLVSRTSSLLPAVTSPLFISNKQE